MTFPTVELTDYEKHRVLRERLIDALAETGADLRTMSKVDDLLDAMGLGDPRPEVIAFKQRRKRSAA